MGCNCGGSASRQAAHEKLEQRRAARARGATKDPKTFWNGHRPQPDAKPKP